MRTVIAAAVTAGLLTAAGRASMALSSAHAAPAPGSTLKLAAHQIQDKHVDVGRKGFSVGDFEAGAAKLTQGGTSAGTMNLVCTNTLVTRSASRQLCSVTLALPHGDISGSGGILSGPKGPAPFDWAIDGGTGSYVGAAGVIHVQPGHQTIHLTVHVSG